jgi:hypothetical protein
MIRTTMRAVVTAACLIGMTSLTSLAATDVAHIELLPCHHHWHTSRGASHVTKNRAAWEIAARRPTFRSS